jgi:acetyl-CoA acetyltransferase
MTTALDEIAIVGIGESEIGRVPHKTPAGMMATAARAATEDAGLAITDIDGIFATTPFHNVAATTLAEYLGIRPRFYEGTDFGGCSFLLHLRHAAAAIAAGMCDVALIAYGSSQRSDRGKLRSSSETSAYEIPYGALYPITQNAMIARRHMHEYGSTSEQLASVAVAARTWAARNPRAFAREPITVDDVLSSPLISSPLHRLDCCLVTDGGAAVIVARRDRITQQGRAVRLLGAAESYTHRNVIAMPDLTVSAASVTGPAAFAQAGVTPGEIDVVQLYDAFTIGPIIELEDLGFVAKGDGGPFFAEGRTLPGGELPVNTNGAGLAYTHPGMLGLFLLTEAVRQLRGEAGEAQVPNAELGLVHGIGGSLASAATVILGRAH